ncbi:hypothetical protein P3S68_033058 [Capsicum galapagoense]
MNNQLISRKRVCDDSDELEINSPEVKRLREDLLDDLYDSEYNDNNNNDNNTPSHDLDSYMKSFAEEITSLPQPELGYLLEASDDELGLPPPKELSADIESSVQVVTESPRLSNEFWPSYEDSFDCGIIESDHYSGNIMGEYVGLDGLFDYSESGFGSGDFLWRPETLPAK